MSDEQLARDGYTAYGEATGGKNYRGEPMPAWEDLGEKIQGAWMAAAGAMTRKAADGIEPCDKHRWLLTTAGEAIAEESLRSMLSVRNCPDCKRRPTA